MKVFCWNVRGLNSSSRQRFIRSWVSLNKPLLGSVLETHVSEDNADFVGRSTFPGWRCEYNYGHFANGRIWVVWDPAISVICFYKSAQIMLCGVYNPATLESFSVAFVYAFNTVVERRALWEELSFISQNSPANSRPLLALGDFNQIITANEHYSVIPHPLPLTGMSEFHNCLIANEFSDMPSRGAFYTWSNGRPEDPILRKLDRAVVNEAWSDTFPESLAVFDPPGDSDHSPCLVSTDANIQRSKKSFKYFSFISTHPKFKLEVSKAWKKQVCVGSKLFTLGQRLREAKICCKKLNIEGFSNIQERTKQALQQLNAIQASLLSSPSPALFREEFVARKRWNFFAAAQESFYKQKSRIRWMKDGDANTSFFHKSVIANQGRNCIKYLRGMDEERIENSDQIKDMIISYFTNLLGSENCDVHPLSVDEIREVLQFRCQQSMVAALTSIPS